ncbi:hypothetical protein GQ457_17G014020 [Hibiscus cannabinus]
MKAGETMNDYFTRTLTIANKMKENGEHKSETEIVEKVLHSMTSKFNYVVCHIEEAQDTTDLFIDELQSSLLVHEQKMLNPEEEQALKSDEWFLDSGCNNHMCNKKDYFADLNDLGQLQEKGLTILVQHNHCKVYHSEKGVIIQSVMSSNRMFKVAAVSLPSTPTCFNTTTKDIGHLWHCRYGHLSFNGLNTLKQKEMIFELPRLIQPVERKN